MGLYVKQSGFFTTIQDLGRFGFQDRGFSVSGAMDTESLKLANLLVDNPEGEAGLELTMTGGTYVFTCTQMIAITGADMQPKRNQQPVSMYQALLFKAGDELSFGCAVKGLRTYLSVAGGFHVPLVLNSKATDIKAGVGGYLGRKLKNGDEISFADPKVYLPNFLSRRIEAPANRFERSIIRVVLGAQQEEFTKEGIYIFFHEVYTITNDSDRMGYRLEGSRVRHQAGADILSDGIAFGAIQIPSNGRPMIMLADRQTTGGYTKIGAVISVDIPLLVQKRPGDEITFQKVELLEAQVLYREREEKRKEWMKKIHKPCVEVLEPRRTSLRIQKLLEAVKGEDA